MTTATTSLKEPVPVFATLRDGDTEIHLECRMSDGQKGAFIQVDADFPEMAYRLVEFVNASAQQKWREADRMKQVRDALEETAEVPEQGSIDGRRYEMLRSLLDRLRLEVVGEATNRYDIMQRMGNQPGFEAWARQQGLDITHVEQHTQRSRGGLFPATYLFDATEYAWRGWANRR